jgi:hypothetical protein
MSKEDELRRMKEERWLSLTKKASARLPTVSVARKSSGLSSTDMATDDRSVPTVVRRGRARLEHRGLTIAATKPWLKLGMSERTWYRRRREKRASERRAGTTGPV